MATLEQRIKFIAKEFADSESTSFDCDTHCGNIYICAVDGKWMLRSVENNLDPSSPRVIEREVTYKSLEQLLNTLCTYEVTALSDSLGFIETPETNNWYGMSIIVQQTFIDHYGNVNELNNRFVTHFKTEEQLIDEANWHWGSNWTGLTYRLWNSQFDSSEPEIRELFDKNHLKAVIKKSSKECA